MFIYILLLHATDWNSTAMRLPNRSSGAVDRTAIKRKPTASQHGICAQSSCGFFNNCTQVSHLACSFNAAVISTASELQLVSSIVVHLPSASAPVSPPMNRRYRPHNYINETKFVWHYPSIKLFRARCWEHEKWKSITVEIVFLY
jgi:hypothetical protein